MNWIARTLWDLLDPRPAKRPRRRPPQSKRRPAPVARPAPERGKRPGTPTPMQARYDALVDEMKSAYGIRVRKWRGSTSGVAWAVQYEDGTTARLIESPYPRGPMSCAVFMHEIGHHAIGLGRYRPRCLEEFHAWKWSLDEMERRGFNVTDAVRKRRDEALTYAIEKALRRGLRALPEELVPFAPPGTVQTSTSTSSPARSKLG